MIGQFDKFNFEKQKRDYRDDFYGIEVCHMDTVEDLEIVKSYVEEHNIKVGFHFPVLNHQWRFRDPQYLSLNKQTQNESYNYMAKEFDRAKAFNPHYVLTHYPKPVILDEDVDWSNWRFADRSEYYFEKEYTYDHFVDQSDIFFKWLSEQGEKHGFMPILELDAVNAYIYDSDFLENQLKQYSNIKLCLDIGRIHLQDCIDPNFDGLLFVGKYAPYTELVHLWNVKVDNNVSCGHYPALESLSKDEGWADVEAYLKRISQENNTYKILFEHKSHLISEEELQNCYNWIQRLV